MAEIDASLVVPVYNERDNLQPLLDAALPVMKEHFAAFEILFVDDGSSDGSAEILDGFAAADPAVRVLHFEANRGQSAAFDAGFRHARGAVVITVDADLQNDPADIGAMLPHLEQVDAVVGIRQKRQDTWWKKVSSRFANGVRNRLTREDIQDTGCPLKVFRAEAIKSVRMFDGMHRFLPTLLKMEGYSVIQVPVHHFPRHAGTSKYGTWDRAFRGLRDALAVRWMQDRHLNWRIRT